ncbi:MAG TPA: stressosome-associated protein Prli42 [Pseudogracilibacillus sp.]|nr:stressosome-associated protein Prli42 [Pseudogracilibacillus sp.]
MAKKQPQKRRPSKRQRRQKVLIYIMVIAMVLSMLTAGLGGIALL